MVAYQADRAVAVEVNSRVLLLQEMVDYGVVVAVVGFLPEHLEMALKAFWLLRTHP